MAKDHPTDINLAQMSKPALAAEVMELRGQIQQVRGDTLKQQIIAATRLDVIRLLGFMMNRDPKPDPMKIAPQTPEVRKVMAAELRDLATHLRTRADEFEAAAEKLIQVDEDDDGQASS